MYTLSRENFFFSFCFLVPPVKVYKKVVKFSFTRQKTIWVLEFSLMYLVSVDPMDRSIDVKNLVKLRYDKTYFAYFLKISWNGSNQYVIMSIVIWRFFKKSCEIAVCQKLILFFRFSFPHLLRAYLWRNSRTYQSSQWRSSIATHPGDKYQSRGSKYQGLNLFHSFAKF